MPNEAIKEEVDIIIQQASQIDITNEEQLISFVKLSVAAADRLLVHISNLTDIAVDHKQSLNHLSIAVQSLSESTQKLTESTQEIATHSQVSWGKAKKAVQISLITLLILLMIAGAWVWDSIPKDYRLVGTTVLLTLAIPKLAKWFYEEWRS
jgi:hypothetical protein